MNNRNKNNRFYKKGRNKKRTIAKRGMATNQSSILPIKSYNKLNEGYSFIMKRPYPDNCLVRLEYQDDSFTRNNAGVALLSWRYRMNSAYDPDPALATGALSGFTEWATFFAAYRVLKFSYDITIINRDAFPMFVTAAPTLTDVGLNYSSTFDMSEFPYGRKSSISAVGGMDKTTIRGQIDLAKFNGSDNYLYNDAYAALTTGNPTTINYFNIGLTSPTVLANGVLISAKLTYDVYFWRHNVLTS